MALTERSEVDQVVINPQTGHVGWRTTTIIERDGVEISRAYHRSSLDPDAYADNPGAVVVPPEVEPHRATVQTPDKVAKARAKAKQNGMAPGRAA